MKLFLFHTPYILLFPLNLGKYQAHKPIIQFCRHYYSALFVRLYRLYSQYLMKLFLFHTVYILLSLLHLDNYQAHKPIIQFYRYYYSAPFDMLHIGLYL